MPNADREISFETTVVNWQPRVLCHMLGRRAERTSFVCLCVFVCEGIQAGGAGAQARATTLRNQRNHCPHTPQPPQPRNHLGCATPSRTRRNHRNPATTLPSGQFDPIAPPLRNRRNHATYAPPHGRLRHQAATTQPRNHSISPQPARNHATWLRNLCARAATAATCATWLRRLRRAEDRLVARLRRRNLRNQVAAPQPI